MKQRLWMLKKTSTSDIRDMICTSLVGNGDRSLASESIRKCQDSLFYLEVTSR